MPQGAVGQLITFAAYLDPDAEYTHYTHYKTGNKDTIKKIAAKRGEPGAAHEILKLNKGRKGLLPLVYDKNKHLSKRQPALRSVTDRLRPHVSIRLPGTLTPGEVVSIPCGDNRPRITAGYAKYDTVDVPSRVGINRFDGYDPVSMEISLQFEDYADESGWIENSIQTLERLAGRGQFPGAAFGPPAVVRISVTDNRGNVVPLIPANYQWTPHNPNAPLYRITGIAWADGALSDSAGRRVRQLCTVTVTQYTPLQFYIRSVSQRVRHKHRPKH